MNIPFWNYKEKDCKLIYFEIINTIVIGSYKKKYLCIKINYRHRARLFLKIKQWIFLFNWIFVQTSYYSIKGCWKKTNLSVWFRSELKKTKQSFQNRINGGAEFNGPKDHIGGAPCFSEAHKPLALGRSYIPLSVK